MNKQLPLFLLLLLSIFSCSPSNKEGSKREKININRDWSFTFSEENDEFSSSKKNGEWETVGLPHSFSLPYFRSESFYVGYGWYQKNLIIKKEWLSKALHLEFDGVFQVAEIYLNGKKVGEHSGGYTGFSLDISKAVKEGNNLLAVRVNNVWDAQLAPRAGEHVFSGGIYRDVYLTVTNPLHVTWNGTFVTTPKVNNEEATVNIKTTIENKSLIDKSFILRTKIVSPNNKQVAIIERQEIVKSGEILTFEQQSEKIKNPQLWSPEHPNLYRIETFLLEGDSVVDNYSSTLGFRWFEWTADQGFFLNGKHLYLEGVNVHQDHAGWGDAVTKAGVYRDVKLMKEAGFNMIRASHYPHHPYFTEVCDELGIFFIPENCVWGIGGFIDEGNWKSSTYPTKEEDWTGYNKSAEKTLEELIKINKNSPSIIAWSMSNEPFFSSEKVIEPMKKLLVDLVDESHKLDPSRPAMIGGAQRQNVDVLGDIAGYNGDGATLYKNPGFPNMVSEYGSCVTDRPGDYTACWGHVTDGEKPAWRSGHAIWCGFDHGSIAGNMGEMGIVDYARIPKRSWYWYRNYFRGIAPPKWPEKGMPKSLKLFADKTTIIGTDATDDVHINVQVLDENGVHISNSPDVTLTIVSGPGEFPTGRSITFKETTRNDIQILEGHAAMEFRSYEGGTTIIEATSKGLKPAQIEIITTGLPKYEEGITPVVKARPYQDYRWQQAVETGSSVKVSDARPTRTNSTSITPASLANDGHKWTKWNPISKDGIIWWELDMENFYNVEDVNITFQTATDMTIELASSVNQKDWISLEKLNCNTKQKPYLEWNIKDNTKVRFIRFTFTLKNKALPLSIGEIEVYGKTN
ncbi:beta-galactosidase [Flammeovirga pectinis]|uniref:Beta-galactosidase n=1 Tax=Flammeovirga pectinis TaxID=2494373 RepID=A0A3Q9FQE1_9BACT|nr:glycoside hydrolase family 2 TIM barrel-domain containing protein [Flammeovirga pectinis]AZQ64686.1 beta-galactosidase [Flammeovirga pectinis]